MRLIYVDEAGTAPKEPIRVVAAVIIDGDSEYRLLEREITRIIDEHVPAQMREGFIFHAWEIFGGGRKGVWQDIWPREDRMDFLKEVACLPLIHDLPIALATVETGSIPMSPEELAQLKAKRIRLETFEHAHAFAHCIERADLFLRKALEGKEIGLITAEDVSDKRRIMAAAALHFRNQPYTLESGNQIQTPFQKHYNITPPEQKLEITQIVDVPHFVRKIDTPMLQLADAVAFIFRRYLSKGDRGEELVYALLGPTGAANFIENKNWFSGTSSNIFVPARYVDPEFRARHAREEFERLQAKAIGDFLVGMLPDPPAHTE